MKKSAFFVLIFAALVIPAMAQNSKVRLAKSIYKGNDFSETIDYSYDTAGRIKKTALSQNGKLHTTTVGFVFNDKGLLVSYIKTYNLNISPQKTTITYNAQNKISSIEIKKTKDAKIVKARAYEWNGQTLKVTDPKYGSQTVVYTFNEDGNIIKTQGLGEPSIAFTNLYTVYDMVTNPLTLLGGFTDEKPLSKNNSLADNYVDVYVINRKIEYQKILISQFKPGGPKIPTQYKNGLPIKVTETSFDKAYKKVMPVSVTTYHYINL